ncbi:MAG: hypothetical protein JW768_07325 [Chitinispirillaceae bacterium]|nr:hypothetical protein [Chitinispirillaceae bacterium]
MESKLTLKLDAGAIGRAKKYVTAHRRHSLSKLVENYFNSLTSSKRDSDANKLPPIVSGLAGIAKKRKAENSKDEYAEYLIGKYK